MSRTRRRVSRGLIGLLAITVVLGMVSFLRSMGDSSGVETAQAETPPAGTAPSADEPSQREPQRTSTSSRILVTETPTPRPAPAAPTRETRPTASSTTATTTTPTVRQTLRETTATAAPATSSRPLSDGRAKKDAGDLLGAREILNSALNSGTLSNADARSARQVLGEINQTVVFSAQRFPEDEYGGTYTVQSGDTLERIARRFDVTWQFLARLNGISDPRRLRAGQSIKVIQGPFHAVVDKGGFTMDMYLGPPGESGALFVKTFRVGLGENDSTPTGTWMVQPGTKLVNPTYYDPRGGGVIHADDPENPLGTHWIGLEGIDGNAVGRTSYGIHGTIEPESIGKQESMGCIRLLNEDVELVFEMLVEGKSTVLVKD